MTPVEYPEISEKEQGGGGGGRNINMSDRVFRSSCGNIWQDTAIGGLNWKDATYSVHFWRLAMVLSVTMVKVIGHLK